MSELALLPITRLSAMMDAGETDAKALTRQFLQRIHGAGRALNCYVATCETTALAEARAAAERASARRRLGPLDGIPVAVKDNIDVAGVPTSNGFGGPAWRVPDEDSEIVRRLRAAGAVILGKLNMHEGALGATTDNPHFGRTINPYRAGYSPGGSSGGSGAAVAAGLCGAALGTDTGGSVRIPAAWCGLVGLKPSFGLISTRGVVPLSYRLDHAGPLTRTVADAATMLRVLAGFDPRCPDSRHAPEFPADDPAPGRLDGIRLGLLRNFDAEQQEPAVRQAFERALRQLSALGAHIVPIALPSYDAVQGRRAGFVRVEAEAAFVHAALYEREPQRFSPAMRHYLDYGRNLPATRLLAADRRIDRAAFELTECLQDVDAIVSSTTPQSAPAFDDHEPENAGSFCIPANFAGVPAVTVPMGADERGLPLGLQIIGPRHAEARVLRIAAGYEAASGVALTPPPLGAPPA